MPGFASSIIAVIIERSQLQHVIQVVRAPLVLLCDQFRKFYLLKIF